MNIIAFMSKLYTVVGEILPLSYIMYLDINNFSRWPMSEKLPGGGFELIKNLSELNEHL